MAYTRYSIYAVARKNHPVGAALIAMLGLEYTRQYVTSPWRLIRRLSIISRGHVTLASEIDGIYRTDALSPAKRILYLVHNACRNARDAGATHNAW